MMSLTTHLTTSCSSFTFENDADALFANTTGTLFTVGIAWCAIAATYVTIIVRILRSDHLSSWRELWKVPASLPLCIASFSQAACPRRRSRWFKCTQRGRSSLSGLALCEMSCPLQRAAAFYKLHLPPPLPWTCRRRANRLRQEQEQQAAIAKVLPEPCPSDQDSSVSSRDSLVSHTSVECAQAETSTTTLTTTTSTITTSSSTSHTTPYPRTSHRPPSRTRIPVSSLLDMARMQQWQTIVAAAPLRRRDAKQRDADGLYPLHWACSGGPTLSVVQTLLDAYPSAARKRDTEGSTPLHFASCYSASTAIHQTLLGVYPQAASLPDRYGRLPLYHAVERNAGKAVLEALVHVDAASVTQPCLPPHPLHPVPLVNGNRVWATRTPLFVAWANLDRPAKLSFRGKRWDKAQYLLRTAYQHHGHPGTGTGYNFIRAVIAMDLYLPEPILDMAIQARPELLRERDETGSYVLHQAAATLTHSPQRARDVLHSVLDAFPAAARVRDNYGRSPLAIALASGKVWKDSAVQALWQAAPEALAWRDGKTGLPPVLVAATAMAPLWTGTEESSFAALGNDPCGLLTGKQQELLRRRSLSSAETNRAKHQYGTGDPDMDALETVYSLLQADPSVLVTATRR